MKYFAVISVLTAAATASLIPTGISDGCSSFLTTLNGDTTFSDCTSALISATSQFGPSADSSATPTKANVTDALANVCASSTECSSAAIRTTLTQFYSNCTAELTSSPNSDVVAIYETLYAFGPLRDAVCTKDDTGSFCVLSIPTAATSGVSLTSLASSLWTSVSSAVSRRAQTVVDVTPNLSTFQSSNLAFFFLKSSLDSTSLCQTCTRNLLTSFITFESDIAFGPGLNNSKILGGQVELYQGIQSTCGASFLTGAVQAAGGLADGIVTSGASHAIVNNAGVISVMTGAIGLAIAAVL